MTRAIGRRIVALVAATVVCGGGTARASGFQLREQSGEGMGNSYAGSTAKAQDADTVFYNPAGMTRLDGNRAGATVAWIEPFSQFHGSSSVGGTAGSGNHLQAVLAGAAYAWGM